MVFSLVTLAFGDWRRPKPTAGITGAIARAKAAANGRQDSRHGPGCSNPADFQPGQPLTWPVFAEAVALAYANSKSRCGWRRPKQGQQRPARPWSSCSGKPCSWRRPTQGNPRVCCFGLGGQHVSTRCAKWLVCSVGAQAIGIPCRCLLMLAILSEFRR